MKLSKGELSRLYRNHTRPAAGNRDACLSDAMLVRVSAGKMTELERGPVAGHLATCSDCASEYRLLRSLRSLPAQTAPPVADSEAQGNVRIFSGAESRGHWFPWIRRTASLVPAIGASLLIVVLALGAWVLSLQRESRQLIAQIDARDQTMKDTQRQLSEAASQIAQLGREVDAFSQPQLNAPVKDLDPQDSVRRDLTQPSRTILIPAETTVFTLVLNVAGQPSFPDYSLEILGPSGASIWNGRGLSKSAFDTFTVAVSHSLLVGGQYHFKLYGLRDSRRTLIEDYRVTIQYQ
jgi:hypothetical protein